MAQVAFDTLAFADTLKKGGFDVKQADTLARAHAEVFSVVITNTIATKQDLRDLEDRIEHRLDHFENKIEKRFTDIDKRFADIDKRFSDIDKQFAVLVPKLTAVFGGIVVTGIGVLVTLMTLLHLHL